MRLTKADSNSRSWLRKQSCGHKAQKHEKTVKCSLPRSSARVQVRQFTANHPGQPNICVCERPGDAADAFCLNSIIYFLFGFPGRYSNVEGARCRATGSCGDEVVAAFRLSARDQPNGWCRYNADSARFVYLKYSLTNYAPKKLPLLLETRTCVRYQQSFQLSISRRRRKSIWHIQNKNKFSYIQFHRLPVALASTCFLAAAFVALRSPTTTFGFLLILSSFGISLTFVVRGPLCAAQMPKY